MTVNDFVYKVDYTWLKSRDDSDNVYNLKSPAERRIYFNQKVGKEIELLREYFNNGNTFVGYMLGPKNAGKGTYTVMLKEALGGDYFENISVGDLVRECETEYLEKKEDSELYKYAKQNYRGIMDIDECLKAFGNRSTKGLNFTTDFILMLIKMRVEQIGKKTIFVDGFPRNVDQVSYSLYCRDLINFRGDPDVFVLINIPVAVIDQRIKSRVVCPQCRAPRSIALDPTTIVKYDKQSGEVYLCCDNPDCKEAVMKRKEGDELGIKPIEARIVDDLNMMDMARKMYGITRIELYNSLEESEWNKYVEDYELTKSYKHEVAGDKVVSTASPFSVDDHGKKYVSLVPAPVVVQFVKQLVNVLGIK